MFFEPLIIGNVLVSSGRVMRPEEVEESLADRPAVRKVVGGWYLCGDVLREMFDALVGKQGDCAMQMTVFRGGSSGNYGLFAQQIDTFEHRFLLPLFEPSVIRKRAIQHTERRSSRQCAGWIKRGYVLQPLASRS